MSISARSQAARMPGTVGEDSTPDDLVLSIQSLLEKGQYLAAKQTASRAVELFSEHSWLTKADRILNPRKVTPSAARDKGLDRRKEYDWLRQNREKYRGKWVALLEDRLIASGEVFEDVLQAVRSSKLEANPLVHRVE